MDLTKTKVDLPSAILVGGRYYQVRTWFKYWLCFLEENRLPPEERNFDFLFVSDIPEDKEEALRALAEFARPESSLPRNLDGRQKDVPMLDYGIDADMIYAAFMQCYGIDLINGMDTDGRELHWHKFLALCSSLKGTKLNDVIEARSYDENDKSSFDEARKKLRDSWTLEGLLETDRQALDSFNETFA